MLRQVFPWLALSVSLLVIFFQRRSIGTLQNQLSLSASSRVKRSTSDDRSMFVPVYAQISKKAMKRLCRQQSHSRRYVQHRVEEASTTTTTQTPIYRKKCKSEVSFGSPNLIAVRPHPIGSAMRDGEHYYLTEYHLGYSLLHFISSKTLNSSTPHDLYTLPYPFQGTDNVVYNGTVFFNYVDALLSYGLKDERTHELKLPLGKPALYNASASVVEIQAEEHGLWTIYKRAGESRLTVRRIVPKSLKVVSTWVLDSFDSSSWCNSFIRCGLLYSVECNNNGLHVQPVFDFYQNTQIAGKGHTWHGIGPVSSVQYDPRSRTITVFSSGKIYNINTF